MSNQRLGWLCLRDCAVPIDDLSPEKLKESARRAIRFNGAPPLRHQGVLNAIAQAFGAHAGWAGYSALFRTLNAFLRRHELTQLGNLHCPVDPVMIAPCGRRALADRLFESGEPKPDRLCLGLQFDWWSIAPIENSRKQTPVFAGGVEKIGPDWVYGLRSAWNLLGDALVEPQRRPDALPVQLYRPNHQPIEHFATEVARARAAARYMRRILDNEPDAFVDVLRFNERVCILRGPNGWYDVVYRDCRDGPPPTFMGEPCVDMQDVPLALVLNSRFDHWYYRERGRWAEADWHAAEVDFYREGGTTQNYPRSVLEVHLTRLGQWQPTPARAHGTPPDWMSSVLQPDGSTLWVSDLVTVGQFNAFLATGYGTRREHAHPRPWGADLEVANGTLDDDQPAAMTGCDAWAYCAYMERKLNLPVRPLSIAEYRYLRRDLPAQPLQVRPGDWDAQDPQVPLPQALPISTTPDGIRFVTHTSVGEWLLERWNDGIAAVDTATLNSARAPTPLDRDLFPGRSWGRYKRIRIGLRICVLVPAGAV